MLARGLDGAALEAAQEKNAAYEAEVRVHAADIFARAHSVMPKTTIALLKDIVLKPFERALQRAVRDNRNPEEVLVELQEREEIFRELVRIWEEDNNIRPLIDFMDPGELSKSTSHTEQSFIRFFENNIIRRINNFHQGGEQVHEIFVHLASLQDCCWRCMRSLTSLGGLRDLGDPENRSSVNVRVFVSSLKEYTAQYFPDVDAMPEPSLSRAHLDHMIAPLDIRGDTMPVHFQFHEEDE